MALKKTIYFKSIPVNDCYIKVWRIEGNKKQIAFNVSYSASSSADAFNSESYSCEYVLNGDNPIKQAYEYLKTLPNFEDAVDC